MHRWVCLGQFWSVLVGLGQFWLDWFGSVWPNYSDKQWVRSVLAKNFWNSEQFVAHFSPVSLKILYYITLENTKLRLHMHGILAKKYLFKKFSLIYTHIYCVIKRSVWFDSFGNERPKRSVRVGLAMLKVSASLTNSQVFLFFILKLFFQLASWNFNFHIKLFSLLTGRAQ